MLDSFDYKEPKCAICGGKEFYNSNSNTPIGRIPIDRIISKVDDCFNKNDYLEAGRLLEYWLREAENLKDKAGELSILSELIGYYRKIKNKDKAFNSIDKALELVNELEQGDLPSGATIYLNCATAYKAFGQAEQALLLYEKTELVYNRTLKPNDSRFGGLYNNMALALVDLKMLEKAETAYLKAISVMKTVDGGQPDQAITYVNLAHMYELMGKQDKIIDCLFVAFELLNDEKIVRNGYFAYVCEKCAPSFEYFGYKVIAEGLLDLSRMIYERA